MTQEYPPRRPRRCLIVLMFICLLIAAYLATGTMACRKKAPDTPVISRAIGTTNFTNLATSGYSNVGTYETIGTQLQVGTWLRALPQASIVITTAHPLTPTGTFQVVTTTAAITITDSAAIAYASAGDILCLLNESDYTISLSTTTNVDIPSQLDWAADDMLVLIAKDGKWYPVSLDPVD